MGSEKFGNHKFAVVGIFPVVVSRSRSECYALDGLSLPETPPTKRLSQYPPRTEDMYSLGRSLDSDLRTQREGDLCSCSMGISM